MSKRTKKASPKIGRPPAGERGERVKDYPQVSFRLPISARDTLAAMSKVRKQPQWRVIVDAVDCYLRALPRPERTQVAELLTGKRSRFDR